LLGSTIFVFGVYFIRRFFYFKAKIRNAFNGITDIFDLYLRFSAL